ncbi:TauD/TfdA family dioxygenase [Burkholderia oklahomensis]|uniref:TauD/TfdA dioxygenase family protein n=1 Tax=Burkholderia oklahomensis TaxID=342113 RepID=UPI002652AD51|nr:TauD/TfdA family dioxygenase [Burkholderia oklahomensis]MDN7676031.1 TauD/TfdA family dioxygenase [Burkholderia oklahomensis]
METLEIRPLSGTIGAQVRNRTLAGVVESGRVDEIRQALLRYKVLFFTNQPDLSVETQIAFGKLFGELETDFPSFTAKPDGQPEVTVFDGAVSTGRASIWHTDLSIAKRPSAMGILCVKETPDSGGDTMWADLEAAYAALSPGMQAFLEGQRAVHDMMTPQYAERPGAFQTQGRSDMDLSNVFGAEHPVVRVHPETGRKCLFVNPFLTSHITGFHSAESAMILNHLYALMERPQYVVRWHWSNGDVALWDNRCTMHTAVDDYGAGRRFAQRVCVRGDVPFGVGERTPATTVAA